MNKNEFIETLGNDIKKSRNIKDSSLKVYLFNILKLHDKIFNNKDIENIKWLKDHDKVIEAIKDMKLSSRKTYLASIVVSLISQNDDKLYGESIKYYRDFILNLQHVLPCKHCRTNLKNNFKTYPLKMCYMKNRDTFSKYIYKLHEIINKMLNKKSGLSYCDVRERYEHFRSRCTSEKKIFKFKKTKKEKGCTEPLYGKKSKCVIKIVPQETRCSTMQIDNKCLKKR